MFQFASSFNDSLLEFAVQPFELPVLSVQFGKYSHLGPQNLRDDRNGKIVHRAVLVALEAVEVGQMHGRNEDDCGFLKARMLANHLGEFESVDLRHAHIHQHDGDIGFEQFLESFLGGSRLDQVLSQFGQDGLIAEQFARLVVDHENVHFFVDAHDFLAFTLHFD